MASDEPQIGIYSVMKQRTSMPIWNCLRILSLQGSNREGEAIVASFRAQMDYEGLEELQATAC
ncbi:MAG: hypothetical protein JST89_06310 [Cyanobacteria bacterium SZAS-4]|nr:hypothetical protein [Cyanobacteria bacterium SZAS-4]